MLDVIVTLLEEVHLGRDLKSEAYRKESVLFQIPRKLINKDVSA